MITHKPIAAAVVAILRKDFAFMPSSSQINFVPIISIGCFFESPV